MMKVSEFVSYLKTNFPNTTFYNGSIDKDEKECVGVYLKGAAPNRIALGGIANTSYSILPVSMLIHWSENSNSCEDKANDIYNFLIGKGNLMIGTRKIASLDLKNSSPIDLGRDKKNIVEMNIRLDILYYL